MRTTVSTALALFVNTALYVKTPYSPSGAPGNVVVFVTPRICREMTAPSGSRTAWAVFAHCYCVKFDWNNFPVPFQLSFQLLASNCSSHLFAVATSEVSASGDAIAGALSVTKAKATAFIIGFPEVWRILF